MQEHQFGGRKVHVTDIAHYHDVCLRQAFRIQATVRQLFNLAKSEKITLLIFAASVKKTPEEVLQRLADRRR